ncbi:MAG: hypothetical protein KDC38_19470, partial [Planctomycetes bacterium]|nr:hypothetical protein [Planctomycetota bacterium]
MRTDPSATDGPGGELTAWNPLEAFILPAVRGWGIILVGAVLGLIAGTFLALVKPNEYESRAKIYVRPTLTPNPELVEEGKAPTAKPDIANQFHLLTSEEVMLRVVQELGAATIIQPYDPAADDNETTPFLMRKLHQFQSWWFGASSFDREKVESPDYSPSTTETRLAVEVLIANTSTTTDGVSNIIDVSYRTHDPLLAQKILTSIIAKHEERHLEMSSVKPVTRIWQQELERYNIEWVESTEELNAFRDQHEVSDVVPQIASLFSEQEELERELRFGDEPQLNFKKQKLAEAESELATTANQVTVPGGIEKVPNPTYVAKYNQLQKQRAQLLELLDVYLEDSPDVVRQKATIARLEAELEPVPQYNEQPVPER